VKTIPNEFPPNQLNDALHRFDALADGIITAATGLSGLNGLGVWAGGIKASSLFIAVIYVLLVLALGAAILFALWVKYPMDLDFNSASMQLQLKHKRCQNAFRLLALGIILLFVALLVYTARSVA
jgi:hypothetical protein